MLKTLFAALQEAGKIQLQYFDQPVEALEKESISSVVTHVDIKSEEKIIEVIKSDFPAHNILSEECGYKKENSPYTWIIDPIDGTSNYAAGIPWFGALIALFEENKPVLAGAFLPVQNSLYLAEIDKGSTRNNVPISVTDSDLKDTLFSFATDYTDDESFLNKGLELFRFIIMRARNVRTTNSLVDFMLVAEGKTGGCVNLFTKIWDIAAPYLIISEAGGVMYDLYGSKIDFALNEGSHKKNYPVIATTSTIFDAFEPLLR